MGIGKEIVATGTEFFVAVGVFPVELSAYQIQRSSALQIGQGKVLYLKKLGQVYDITSHLICMFYAFFKLTYLQNLVQIFAKQ